MDSITSNYIENEISFKESAVELKKFKQKKSILKSLYVNEKMAIADLSEALFISIPTLTSYDGSASNYSRSKNLRPTLDTMAGSSIPRNGPIESF